MNAKNRILNSAILLAKQYGWRNLKRDVVAKEAGSATGSVNHYFGTMEDLRSEVMRIAVERRIADCAGGFGCEASGRYGGGSRP